MKKLLLCSALSALTFSPLFSQSGRSVASTVISSHVTSDNVNRNTLAATHRIAGLDMDPSKANSNRYAHVNPLMTDVIINNSVATNIRHVKIATAFNGWIYAAYTLSDVTGGGVGLSRSKDNGLTWTALIGTVNSGLTYTSVDVEVAGSDTNSLSVFLAGILLNGSGNYISWVDKYNGTSAAFIGEYFNENTGANMMYDIALATDFLNPSYVSTGYSVAVVYSMTTSPADSLIYAASVDGGVTYTNRQVFSTGYYLRDVSLAYGFSQSRSNGRYFIAFESRNLGADVGNIGFIHTDTDPTSTLTTAVYVDSADGSMAGRCRYPSIAMQDDAANNDSSDVVAIITVDRQYSSTDWDELSLFSQRAVNSTLSNWHYLGIDNSGGDVAIEGDITYSPQNAMFGVTYYDSTAQTLLVAKTAAHTLNTTSVWNWTSMQYNDVLTNLIQPKPQISFAPNDSAACLAWNSEGITSNGVPLFDKEFMTVGISSNDLASSFDTPYPDPANDVLNFNFTLSSESNVTCSVYNIVGELMITTDLGSLSSGEHKFQQNVNTLPAGMYLYRFANGNSVKSGRFMVTR
jgi:hypothetical protein